MVPLWEHMTGIYGHKWVSSFGEEVSETWVRGCADLTGDELVRGLHSCLYRSQSNLRAGDDDWPPTLGEFQLLCRPQKPTYHYEYAALPMPKRSPEQLAEIEADIARLRVELGARPREPGSDDEAAA